MAMHSVILRCMGEPRNPCPAEFRSAGLSSAIAAQKKAQGWETLKTTDGVRHRCPMHVRLAMHGGGMAGADVASAAFSGRVAGRGRS